MNLEMYHSLNTFLIDLTVSQTGQGSDTKFTEMNGDWGVGPTDPIHTQKKTALPTKNWLVVWISLVNLNIIICTNPSFVSWNKYL